MQYFWRVLLHLGTGMFHGPGYSTSALSTSFDVPLDQWLLEGGSLAAQTLTTAL